MVVLKRLTDALRDGDRVLAVVRGSAVNQDGRQQRGDRAQRAGPTGVAAPGVDVVRIGTPSDIDYVEAHGTGTPLGDPIELEALSKVFAIAERHRAVGARVGEDESRSPGSRGGRRRLHENRARPCATATFPKHLNFTQLTPHATDAASSPEPLRRPGSSGRRRVGRGGRGCRRSASVARMRMWWWSRRRMVLGRWLIRLMPG